MIKRIKNIIRLTGSFEGILCTSDNKKWWVEFYSIAQLNNFIAAHGKITRIIA